MSELGAILECVRSGLSPEQYDKLHRHAGENLTAVLKQRALGCEIFQS